MATLARLNVLVGADISDLERKLAKTTRSLKKTGRDLSQVGKTLTAAITLPIAAVGAAAVKMASDAEEAANKFNVVFGGAAERVSQEIDRLRETIPAARHELIGMAAGVQDLLIPLGLTPGAAADMSVKILELAGDLASFNNLRVTDVLRDIRSGLVGQSEPLLKFGADTRVAAVEAKALELGLIKEGEALTNTARAMAVYNIVLDSNVAAQGDAARTAGEAANTFKFFVAEAKDLAVAFGNVLLPVITPLVQRLTDLIDRFNDLSPQTKRFIVIVAGIAAAVGPVVFILGQFAIALAALAPLLAKAVIGMTAFTASLLTNPVFLAIAAGVAAVAVAISLVGRDAAAAKPSLDEFNKSLKGSAKLARELDEALQGIDTPQFEVFTAERQLQRAEAALKRFRESAGIEGPGIDITVRPEVLGKLLDLGRAVTDAKLRVDDAREALANFGKEEAAAEAARRAADAAKRLAERTKEIAEVFTGLDTSLRVARANARLFGDEFDFTGARLSAFEGALQSLLGLGLRPTDAAVIKLAEDIKLLRDNIELVPSSIVKVQESLVLAREAVRIFSEETRTMTAEALRELENTIAGVSRGIADVVVNLATGKLSFKDFVQSAIADIAKLIVEMIALKAISTALGVPIPGTGGGGGGLIGGIFDLFGGFFARGGTLKPGQFGVVGEAGPELVFAGSAAANIQPGGGLTLRVDTASLPPAPRVVSPDALAVDDWWRSAFSALVADGRDRGVQFA